MSERRARGKSVPPRFPFVCLACAILQPLLRCPAGIGCWVEWRACVCLRAVDVPLCKPRSPSGEKKMAAVEIGLRAFLAFFVRRQKKKDASNERGNGTVWCLACTNSSFVGFDFVDADSVDAYMFV